MTTAGDDYSIWQVIPDSVLLHIFSFLPSRSLLNASQVCKSWHLVAKDEYLWKDLLYRTWHIDVRIPMAPGKQSWLQEFKRLYYHTPQIESEVLHDHTDQVLHISFSHDGKLFATSSKDGFIKVWTSSFPTRVLYYADMREFTWKYTQYSQFNENDTLLLVSGVHFGAHSTSGEIAVFNLVDGFTLQCRVLNKPYDIFGTWYNENYLLSANLHWLGHLTSCSVLWLNKASQALESENESVVMRLYKFRNINASSIRTVMIARCLENESPSTSNVAMEAQTSDAESQDVDMSMKGAETSQSECSQGKFKRRENKVPIAQKVQVMNDGDRGVRFLEVDDSNGEVEETIEYSSDYRIAETSQLEQQQFPEHGLLDYAGCSSMDSDKNLGSPLEFNYDDDESMTYADPGRDICRPRRRRREENKDSSAHSAESLASQSGENSWRHKSSRSVHQKQPNSNHDLNSASNLSSTSSSSTPSSSSLACKRSGCQRNGASFHGPSSDINVNTNSTGNNNDNFFRVHHPVGVNPASIASSSAAAAASSPSPPSPPNWSSVVVPRPSPSSLPSPTLSLSQPGCSNSKTTSSKSPSFPLGPNPNVSNGHGKGASLTRSSLSGRNRNKTNNSSSAKVPEDGGGGGAGGGAGDACAAAPNNSSQRTSVCRMTGLDLSGVGDKYLIFTTGMTTYTPHQIGIKRVRSLDDFSQANVRPRESEGLRLWPVEDNEDENNMNLQRDEFDTVDHLIELHGHIIGMCLSPDHRYLYVNSRPWPQDYEIDDPLYPPPIAQEIDIHVIDLKTMHEVGTMHRAHKAYTPNDECFFIFLDVCQEYVASGAEDKHGYLWDRHYGICLTKFPHADVVNSVAFNPHDPEMLITASDDNSLKIWRSRNREKQVKVQKTST